MRQARESSQRIQVRKLGQVIRRQHQVLEVGNGLCKGRLNARDAVPCEEESRYTGRQGKVSQDLNVIVGEVDGVVRLAHLSYRPNVWRVENTYASDTQVLNRGDPVSCSRRKDECINSALLGSKV